MKLLLMGRVSREYPSYINILGAQPAMMAPSETDGETQYKLSDLAKVPTDDAANSMGEGLIDRDVDTRPVNMKKKKNNKSSKKTKVNPYAEKNSQRDDDRSDIWVEEDRGDLQVDIPKNPSEGEQKKTSGTKRKWSSDETPKKRQKGSVDRSACTLSHALGSKEEHGVSATSPP